MEQEAGQSIVERGLIIRPISLKLCLNYPATSHITGNGVADKLDYINMKDWKKNLKEEFGIHFKNNSGELQFLEVFIEELLSQRDKELRERIGKSYEKALSDLLKTL